MIVLSACALGPFALAISQEILYTVRPAQPGSPVGGEIQVLGDLNGDSIDDWVMQWLPGNQGTGAVSVRSGLDGSSLYELTAPANVGFFGATLAAFDDIDGDGCNDFALGATNRFVRMVSGRTGALIYEIPDPFAGDGFGSVIASTADVDGDGHRDLLTGTTLATVAELRSGADGTVLATYSGTFSFGRVAAGLGDVDGDGKDDFAIGQPTACCNPPEVRVYSGDDGSELYVVTQVPQISRVEGAGDLDSDGRSDFFVSTGLEIWAISGVDGSTIYTLPLTGLNLIYRLDSISDIDGDGIGELAIGRGNYPGSLHKNYAAVIHSGVDGRALVVLETGISANSWDLAELGDVDQDGSTDLLVAFNQSSVTHGVRLYSSFVDCDGNGTQDWQDIALGTTPDVDLNAIPDTCQPPPNSADDVYCTAKPSFHGCAASVAAHGVPTKPQRTLFWLQATGVRWQKSGLFFFGHGRLATPFLGGTLCVQPPLARGPVSSSLGPSDSCLGALTLQAGDYLDQNPAFAPGDTVNAQAWYRDPPGTFGIALSNALEFTLVP